MKENSFVFTLERFHQDVAEARTRIIDELREDIKLHSGYRDIKTRNFHFRSFFNRELMKIYEVRESNDNGLNQTIYFNAITKALCDQFLSWHKSLLEELLMDFFKDTSNIIDGFKNYQKVLEEHQDHFRLGIHTKPEYNDAHLLNDFSIIHFYPTIVRVFCLSEMGKAIQEIPWNDEYINNAMKKLEGRDLDLFLELRNMKNLFNTADVDELIDFFKPLLGTAKGQDEPVISIDNFKELITLISRRHEPALNIPLNLHQKDLPAVRRLFYDFYDKYKMIDKEAYLPKPITKKDYLRFIENFQAFKGATARESWIKETSPTKQKTTLKSLLKN